MRIPILALLASLAAAQPPLPQLKKEAEAEVRRLAKLNQEIVDSVFSFGELGFQEIETSRYLTAILEKHGFRVTRGVAGIPTAWVAEWGSGKPVIGFITDLDGIPRASQKPGVAYRDPLIPEAPGHGEGHNSGNAVNIVAALALQKVMEQNRISGTLRLYPGVAEELLATKAYMVRAGLFRDVDIMLGCHVGAVFATSWGAGPWSAGLLSIQYSFHGAAAHAAGAPWRGKSALDAVELMNAAWNYKREHLRPEHRLHYVITNGGDQPNVVPSEASVWYYYREQEYPRIKELHELGRTFAKAAALMTGTTYTERIVGSAWPIHLNKVVAEVQQKNIEAIGMPAWSDADQQLARALQRELGNKPEGLELKVRPLSGPAPGSGGSDDIGDISWVVPMVYLSYPANIPNLPGHSWADAVAMATPIAHQGSLAGAKAQALTALDFLTQPDLVKQAWDYFRNVQTKDLQYQPLIGPEDQPAIELNREKMDAFRPRMKPFYYDSAKYRTYLEQLGIRYPVTR